MSEILKNKPEDMSAKGWLTKLYHTVVGIAESSDGVCRHVNDARKALGLPLWKENMTDPMPCAHTYIPCYRTYNSKSWFGTLVKQEFDFALCTKCAHRSYEVGETVTTETTIRC